MKIHKVTKQGIKASKPLTSDITKYQLIKELRSLDPIAIAKLTQQANSTYKDDSVTVISVWYMRDADTAFSDYSAQEIIAVVNESGIDANHEYLCRDLMTGDWYSFNEDAMEDDMMSDVLYSLANYIVESEDDLGNPNIRRILDSNTSKEI